MAPASYQSVGTNAQAAFTLKLHRGEGMVLLGMNWKSGKPPNNFVGFGIEYQIPSATSFTPINTGRNDCRAPPYREPLPKRRTAMSSAALTMRLSKGRFCNRCASAGEMT